MSFVVFLGKKKKKERGDSARTRKTVFPPPQKRGVCGVCICRSAALPAPRPSTPADPRSFLGVSSSFEDEGGDSGRCARSGPSRRREMPGAGLAGSSAALAAASPGYCSAPRGAEGQGGPYALCPPPPPLSEGLPRKGRSSSLKRERSAPGRGELRRAGLTLGDNGRLLLNLAAGRERTAEGAPARPRRLRASSAGTGVPHK